jgi:hypothetical protein
MEFSPTLSGIYFITMKAEKDGHATAATSFYLIVAEIPTQLRTESNIQSDSVLFTANYSIDLFYERTDLPANITEAYFSMTEIEGLSYEVSEVAGVYTLKIVPSSIGKWLITIIASQVNHRNATIIFELEVVEVSVEISGVGPPNLIYYNQTYSFTLEFQTTEESGIAGALVTPTHNPACDVTWNDGGNGSYYFTIIVRGIGTYDLFLRFHRYGYTSEEIEFSFDVLPIPTQMTVLGYDELFYAGRTYSLCVHYNSTYENGIEDAELTVSSSIYEFYQFNHASNGWYYFSLTPAVGSRNASIWMSKNGYQEQAYSFILEVSRVPLMLSPSCPLNQSYSEVAGSTLDLELVIIAADTEAVVTGLDIEYKLVDKLGLMLEEGDFVENSSVYSISISVPSAGSYTIHILIDDEDYLEFNHQVFLLSRENPDVITQRIFTAGVLGAISLFLVMGVVTISRRVYLTKKTKDNLELLEYKGRLSDAKNLLGILVIHREVGLPIYSKILKGGFEESMLSSFITAIAQFRSEFSDDEPIWSAIPISEVISAVQTEILICAMISVEAPSDNLKRQLESFGAAVGERLDNDDVVIRKAFHSIDVIEDLKETIEDLFDDIYDRAITMKYVGVRKNIPQELSPVGEVIRERSIGYGVELEDMITQLILTGYGEFRAHRMVFRAVDNGFLIPGATEHPILDDDE